MEEHMNIVPIFKHLKIMKYKHQRKHLIMEQELLFIFVF
jgi:hypothetical protein